MIVSRRSWALFIAPFFLLTGCGGGGGGTPTSTGSVISGSVQAPNGVLARKDFRRDRWFPGFLFETAEAFTGLSPVPGAPVTLLQINTTTNAVTTVGGVAPATTNSSGAFQLSVPSSVAPSAVYLVSVGSGAARIRAFLDSTSGVDIDPASEITVRLVLEEADGNSSLLDFTLSEIRLIQSAVEAATANVSSGSSVAASVAAGEAVVDADPDVQSLLAESANSVPVANAGTDQSVLTGQTVTLNGSGTDADGDSLTYSWSQESGPTVALSSATAQKPTFVPSVEGTHVFSLTVSDGEAASGADSVTIVATKPNTPPTADAGADQTATVNDSIALEGMGSDADGDALTYAWTQTSGPAASLSDAAAQNPTFTAFLAGVYVFSLTVSDGNEDSAPDETTVSVSDPAANTPPTADAGQDQSGATVGETASLSGSGSDADDDSLTYLWTQTSGPAATLSDPAAQNPTFTPSDSGVYVFSLTVNDGQESSAPDAASVTVDTWNVVYSSGGFSPNALTISVGDKIRWTVQGSSLLQLAEGTHPTHTDCTFCPQGSAVGATVSITQSQPFTFPFAFAGQTTPSIHNHAADQHTMSVIVGNDG